MSKPFPTFKEALWATLPMLAYLCLVEIFIGLRTDHFLIAGLFLFLFYIGPAARKLAVALLPFILFAICYDWMRVYPNFEVNPIDVQGLYDAEKSLFGITVGGQTLIPCEFFAAHHCTIADFMAGIFYLCWVPVPIAFGIWLYLKGKRQLYLRFSIAFLFVNLIGFAGYYIHPAAPPWYAMNYGFDPILDTPGNVAGLGRFDELLGCQIFHSIYGRNANVFAAIPSLQGIWWTAIYSGHHYIIDVLLGITCALAGMLIFEKGLLKWGCFRRFFYRYARYIATPKERHELDRHIYQ